VRRSQDALIIELLGLETFLPEHQFRNTDENKDSRICKNCGEEVARAEKSNACCNIFDHQTLSFRLPQEARKLFELGGSDGDERLQPFESLLINLALIYKGELVGVIIPSAAEVKRLLSVLQEIAKHPFVVKAQESKGFPARV
jgi:hypothetical protein